MIIKQIEEELLFFELIDRYVDTVFDMGCRTNIDYAILKPNKTYHLFDVNSNHIKTIKKENDLSKYKINLYNFGLGKENQVRTFCHRSESFYRIWSDQISQFEIKNIYEFLKSNSIFKIDFLKMDIEGSEPEILYLKDIVARIPIVQFEYASTWDTWKFDGDRLKLNKIMSLYDDYIFFFLKDPNHPINSSNTDYKLLLKINELIYKQIELYRANNDCGCNIVMIHKELYKTMISDSSFKETYTTFGDL